MYQKLPYFKKVKAYSHFESDVKGFNLDANIIATGNLYGQFKVFDIITGKTLVSFVTDQVNPLIQCISINGNKHIAAGSMGYALVWDLQTRKCQKILPKQKFLSMVTYISYDPHSQYIVTNQFNAARLWNIETGKKIKKYRGDINSMVTEQFNSVGDKLMTFSFDNTATIWNVYKGEQIHNLKGHINEIRCGQFDSSGDLLATGSDDLTCKIWDVKTGQCIKTLTGHTKEIINLSFNSSGSKIVTVSQDGSGRVYNVQTGELMLQFGQNCKIKKVEYFQSNDLIIAQREDEKVIVLAENGECLQEFENSLHYSLNQQEDILLTLSKQGELKIWKNIHK